VIFPFRRIEKLREVEPASRVIDGTITSVYSLFPNASISVLSKHTNLVILEPISPSQSKWVIYTLINKSNKKGKLSKEDAMKMQNLSVTQVRMKIEKQPRQFKKL
jgi:hypothetical protein